MSTLPPMPQRIRDIFNAAFAFRRKYQFPENTTAWWDAASAEMGAIVKHFDGDPLAVDMLSACYLDIEREMEANTG